jgi:hypothetical protein
MLTVIISSTVTMSQKNCVKKTKFCNGYVMFSAGQNINYCTKQLLCAVVYILYNLYVEDNCTEYI